MSVMSDFCPVAIIGAGPYGLSIAAHLHARGVEFRIFGRPMHSWQTQMPAGMFLKSHGFASNLFDPQRRYTLERFVVRTRFSIVIMAFRFHSRLSLRMDFRFKSSLYQRWRTELLLLSSSALKVSSCDSMMAIRLPRAV